MLPNTSKKSQSLPEPILLTDKQTAVYLCISEATLRRSRMQGARADHISIPFIRIGRAIRYAKADLDAWLASCRVGSPTPVASAAPESDSKAS